MYSILGKRPPYPATRLGRAIDHYHGNPVADPYRWLENQESPETQSWLEAQHAYTLELLRTSPWYARLRSRLNALWAAPRYGAPFMAGGRYFTWIAVLTPGDKQQEQPVLYQFERLDGPAMVALDPNAFSMDGPVAVTHQEASPDGRLLAYAISYNGSDWQELRIRDLRTGKDYPETLSHCKFVGVAWQQDGSGFFYNRHPAPGEVAEDDRHNYSRVYWHAIGTSQEDDSLIISCPENKGINFYPIASSDGSYLLLHLWDNGDPHGRLLCRPMAGDRPFQPLVEGGDAHYDFIDSIGDTMFVLTDLDAPRGRIIAVDLAHPDPRHWRTVVPEGSEAIAFASMVADQLLVVYLHHASYRAVLFSLAGVQVCELPLPPCCAVTGLWSKQGAPEMFLCLESFLRPPAVYRYDAATATFAPLWEPALDFDPTPYETRQVFYPAGDGTLIPMFLTHRRGLALDGTRPVVLNGYGGFGLNVPPLFWLSMVPWLEAGGIFAVANIRGGGEYGAAWHQAAVRERKQTSFDDFAAAAAWLVKAGYTCPARLGIIGASNGGLLVAACLVQRPDLFGAVVSQVPVTDMLRYHRFTVGQHLTAEFGNADAAPEEFAWLHAYSPLHNVRAGVSYPATLVTTAEYDDRVLPLHALKFVAALQIADPGGAPHLLWMAPRAGHCIGRPAAQLIEEMADTLAFLFQTLGVDHLSMGALARVDYPGGSGRSTCL